MGSHHTPAIELIHQLQSDTATNWQIHYIAHIFPSETHLTHTIIPKLKINFHPIESGKFDRRFLDKTIIGIPKTINAIFQSLKLIRQIKPDIIVAFGGYVSVPVIIAAKILHIKSIIHEQTLTNSLTTRICAIFVNKVALSFDSEDQKKTLPKNKVVFTGNLIRQEIFNNSSKIFDGLKSPIIYITGGSQGSSTINQTVKQILPQLKNYSVIHQTGPLEFPQFSQLKTTNYFPVEFVDAEDIGWVYHHADIFISRSGANTCQDFSFFPKPTIFIPFPYAQQNEQLKNAQWFQQQLPQLTLIIDQFELTPEKLLFSIMSISQQPKQTSTIDKHQNPKLLKLIYDLV